MKLHYATGGKVVNVNEFVSVQHRQREKEYRKKLAELRSTDKPEIQSEDDLFNKLDALELQEELEDELHRFV